MKKILTVLLSLLSLTILAQVKDSIFFVDSLITFKETILTSYIHKETYTNSFCSTGSIYAGFCNIDSSLSFVKPPLDETSIKTGFICLYVSPYEFAETFSGEIVPLKFYKRYENNKFEEKIKRKNKKRTRKWIIYNIAIQPDFKFYHYKIEINYLKQKLRYLENHALLPNSGYIHVLVPA